MAVLTRSEVQEIENKSFLVGKLYIVTATKDTYAGGQRYLGIEAFEDYDATRSKYHDASYKVVSPGEVILWLGEKTWTHHDALTGEPVGMGNGLFLWQGKRWQTTALARTHRLVMMELKIKLTPLTPESIAAARIVF